ncbi:hypothetical protein Y032_0230g2974 [Ancylostoma ceylanicum]|uniref:Peptidase S1 domain-containing protein n=1 Tax=Ancylostoma ceylanicum TaxID=53326 RepID=A0A016SFX1_9BILA|nr:hypothetical protein Y032_0230g2974 [Ancylostoma ceylanicum]
MEPWLISVFLLALNSLVSSRKLTTEENERNSEKCGVHFLGENVAEKHLTKRSVGGRQFIQNEYPWTVTLKLKGASCSGVQISPRHILTAAHCIVADTLDDHQSKGPDSVVSVMIEPEDVSVYIRGNMSNGNYSTNCLELKNAYKVTKITVHKYETWTLQHDVALIELSVNISEDVSTPICMPDEDLSLAEVLFATGTGRDSTTPATLGSSPCLVQRVVAQKYDYVNGTKHEIVTTTFAKSTCEGDSGGPVFQVHDDGRHILVGLTSSGPPCEKRININMRSYCVDVRAYVDWICKYSGVCPIEEGKIH